MSARDTKAAPIVTYRYGDFPDLFWDADPAAPVNVEHPVVLTRILTREPGRNHPAHGSP